jgi:hypothetical protein
MNPIIQKVLYVSGSLIGIAVFSELFWQLFLKYYKYIKNDEINEVIFTHDAVRQNPALAKPTKTEQKQCINEAYVPAILSRIVDLIDASKESIHICMYILTVHGMSSALLRAHKRGQFLYCCSSMGCLNLLSICCQVLKFEWLVTQRCQVLQVQK